jgi:hypothetical protein
MSCEQNNDCPICFEIITSEKNNIVTECGHNFHASCLMRNITCNGFSCPCCRATMAIEKEEEDEDEEDEYEEEEEDEYEYEEEDEYEEDDSLRGLRLFTNRIEGIENHHEDLVAELHYNEGGTNFAVPSIQEFVAFLREQGVTYEQLVANAMMDIDEYTQNNHLMANLDDQTDDLWVKMRTYINDYSHGLTDDDNSDVAEERVDVELRDLSISSIPLQQEESYKIEFVEGGGFNIIDEESSCYMRNWGDINFSEISIIGEDIDYNAQPKLPMISV